MDFTNLSYYILCIIFFTSIICLFMYTNLHTYYHSFIITLVIYILFMIMIVQYSMKTWRPIDFTKEPTIFSWLFIKGFTNINSNQIFLIFTIIIIILKIVFVSMMIDLLSYGHKQLKNYTMSNKRYSFNEKDRDTTNNFSNYKDLSYSSFAILLIQFIIHLFAMTLKKDSETQLTSNNTQTDNKQKEYLENLCNYMKIANIVNICIILLVQFPIIVSEIYYSNTLHRIKERGNMLYDVSNAKSNNIPIVNTPNRDLTALSYSKSQLPINYTNYFGFANRW